MNDKTLLTTGVVGTILVALCCFTPFLVVLLSGAGLAAAIGYLDLILLPALAIFAGITVYALWRRRRNINETS